MGGNLLLPPALPAVNDQPAGSLLTFFGQGNGNNFRQPLVAGIRLSAQLAGRSREITAGIPKRYCRTVGAGNAATVTRGFGVRAKAIGSKSTAALGRLGVWFSGVVVHV